MKRKIAAVAAAFALVAGGIMWASPATADDAPPPGEAVVQTEEGVVDEAVADPPAVAPVAEEPVAEPPAEPVAEEPAPVVEEPAAPVEEPTAPAAEDTDTVTTQGGYEHPKKVWVCKYVGIPGIDEVLKDGKNPIDVSRVGKWHERMPENRRHSLATRMGRLAEFFGYDMNDPAVLAPVGAGLIIHGGEIAERIDEFDDLNLRERAGPGLAERHYHPGRMQLHGVGDFAKKTPPPPEPPFHVRVWRVMPVSVRRQFHPKLTRIRRRVIHARRMLRRR